MNNVSQRFFSMYLVHIRCEKRQKQPPSLEAKRDIRYQMIYILLFWIGDTAHYNYKVDDNKHWQDQFTQLPKGSDKVFFLVSLIGLANDYVHIGNAGAWF